MKERTGIIKHVLRGLGFGLLAVVVFVVSVVFMATCTFTIAAMRAQERQQQIEAEYPYQPVVPPQWTPDGSQIVFADRGNVYSVDVNGTSLQLIHGGDGEEDLFYAPDVSPDGTRIAYLKNYRRWPWESRHLEIATSALDGTDERVLTDLDYRRLGNPSWSPDGSRIAFAEREKIYTIAADGSDLQVVIGGPGLAHYSLRGNLQSYLVWSPDGRRLAFVAYDRDPGPSELRAMQTIAVDGSDPRKVGQGHSVPAWSPDGGRLAFAEVVVLGEDSRMLQLYTVGSDGSNLHQIARRHIPPLRWSGATSWSPDGTEILVGSVAVRVDGSELRLLPALNSGGVPRLDTRSYGLTSWSPDGSRIALQESWDHPHPVYTVSLDGSDIRVLVQRDRDGNLSAVGEG